MVTASKLILCIFVIGFVIGHYFSSSWSDALTNEPPSLEKTASIKLPAAVSPSITPIPTPTPTRKPFQQVQDEAHDVRAAEGAKWRENSTTPPTGAEMNIIDGFAQQHPELSQSSPSSSQKPALSSKPTPTPTNRPITGTLFIVPRGERLAPFSVTAPTVSDCFVRLHCPSDPDNDIGVYIRAGDSVTIDVPLGIYTLYYATGYDWKGAGAKDNLVFGPDTQWFTSEESLVFYDDGECYNGHDLTLRTVYNGNFDTDEIDNSRLPF